MRRKIKLLIMTILITVAPFGLRAEPSKPTASGQSESSYRLPPQVVGETTVDGMIYPKAIVLFRFLSDSVRYADSASARAKGKVLLGLTIRYERRIFMMLGRAVFGLDLIDTTKIENVVAVDTARTDTTGGGK